MTYPLKAFTDASISFVRKHLDGYFKIKFYKKSKKNILTQNIHTIIKYILIYIWCVITTLSKCIHVIHKYTASFLNIYTS